jgi:tripartite-type tricarboxylate transporter receptor subunit TctC
VLSLHKAGKIRLLAVTTSARLVSAPDIPTAIESGVGGMIAQGFIALFAPAKTPEPVITKVADATRMAMTDPGYRQLLISSGLEPAVDSSPEKARDFVQKEIERWTPVIKSTGLKLD